MNAKITRIAVFIDGTFFIKVNTYYKYQHERKSNINFNGLFEYIREEVSQQEQIDKRYCQVVESHWFRGRFSTTQVERRYNDDSSRLNQLTIERRIEDIFMFEGIVIHNYPLQINQQGEVSEKGIDVWLSLEAYELAVLKRFDVLVLIAGDTDYVPLIRKLNGLGTRVMVLGWDFSYESKNASGTTYKNYTRTGQALIDECTYPIMMDKKIDDRTNKNNSIINAIFNS